jgi:hypothetical protein
MGFLRSKLNCYPRPITQAQRSAFNSTNLYVPIKYDSVRLCNQVWA